jgi:septal ring-binding cell division protein DamX
MRFKSRAQRRKFAELLVKGEISPETFEEWNRDTGSAKLPERVKPASSRRKKSKAKPTTRPKARRPSKSRAKAKRKTKRRSR